MWLVEHTIIKEAETLRVKSALDTLHYPCHFFGFNKADQSIYFDDQKKDLKNFHIVRCSIPTLKYILENKKLDPFISKLHSDIMFDPIKFDQNYYANEIDLPFLNQNALFLTVKTEEDLLISFDTDKFVKPTSDLKHFNAEILPRGKTLKELLGEYGLGLESIKGRTVLFSDLVKICGEYRSIFIGDQLVGISKYLESGNFDVSGTVPTQIINCAKSFAKKYHPSSIFTLDLCETSDGKIKIIEYNCWNVSGLYNIDRVSLFKSVEYFYRDYFSHMV